MTVLACSPNIPTPARPTRRRQTLIGVGFALAISIAWIAIHLFAMFGMTIRPATLPLAAAILVVQCWLSVGMFIVAHDAMHGSLAPGRPDLNARIGAASLFLYAGFGWTKLREAHFDHHRHPGSDRDPDFDAAHPRNPARWYWTFLTRYFGWQSVVYVTVVVQFYWWVLGVPLANLILLYSVPAILSSVQLFYFGTYRPHAHGDDGFDDRHNARSEHFGPLVSLATCFHFGYHHEHHVNPNVPWWALPQVRRAALRDGATP